MSRILVVDDERSMREFVSILLVKQNHDVETAENGVEAIERLGQGRWDLVITDLKMPGKSGLDVLQAVKERHPSTQVILMTAFATTATAVEAMKAGARDYVTKPFKVNELLVQVEKALEVQELERENLYLKERLEGRVRLDRIVGRSSIMKNLFELVIRVAPARTTVLVTRESGTGKELVARALHAESDRSEKDFIPINCGAIPESLIESELFGHIKGAFTGASSDRDGIFVSASGGTVFLDEVGELPPSMQVKLLRVLQEKKVRPVGASREIETDVRVVAATNRDLQEMVEEGTFREDLYYRLNVIELRIPPLRDRREDLPLLVQHFLGRFGDELGRAIRGVEADAMTALLSYDYPGNVRELENVIERAVTLSPGEMITLDALPPRLQSGGSLVRWASDVEIPEDGLNLDEIVENLERNLIRQALKRSGGVRKQAAKLLGMSFRSMRYRLDKYGIEVGDE